MFKILLSVVSVLTQGYMVLVVLVLFIIQVTSVTGNLTIDMKNNRNMLLVIFLKRIIFLMIFFILFPQLNKVLSSFRKNEPFNLANVKRLKIIAFTFDVGSRYKKNLNI